MKAAPLRIVPLLVAAAIPLLGVKLYNVAGEVFAQAVQPAEASTVTPTQAPPAAPATPAAAEGKPAPATPAGAAPGAPAPRDPASYSPAELDVLQSLAQRRAELDKRADELDGREVMLKAAEQRIAEKIESLKTMEKNINDLLKKKDEENDAKIKSLVKIYETMKPADAARIFEQLDMPVLLEVVQNMKELKAAPILAAMQPQKAKAVTLALADRQQAPKP